MDEAVTQGRVRRGAGQAAAAAGQDEVFRALAGFRLALRRFLAFSEAATSAADVTSQQYQALLVITTHGRAMPVGQLAEQMLMKQNGAVQLVDRLVQAGLVQRRPNPDDRRGVMVVMTARGQEKLAGLADQHMRELLAHAPLLAESLRLLSDLAQSASDQGPAAQG